MLGLHEGGGQAREAGRLTDLHQRRKRSEYMLKYSRGSGYWKKREGNWRTQGIVEADGRTLRSETYWAVLAFQGGRCALSGTGEMWVTFVADHDRKTGRFRGVLAADVNRFALGKFEQVGLYRGPGVESAIRSYLEHPPYERWLRAGSPPAPDRPGRWRTAFCPRCMLDKKVVGQEDAPDGRWLASDMECGHFTVVGDGAFSAARAVA